MFLSNTELCWSNVLRRLFLAVIAYVVMQHVAVSFSSSFARAHPECTGLWPRVAARPPAFLQLGSDWRVHTHTHTGGEEGFPAESPLPHWWGGRCLNNGCHPRPPAVKCFKSLYQLPPSSPTLPALSCFIACAKPEMINSHTGWRFITSEPELEEEEEKGMCVCVCV